MGIAIAPETHFVFLFECRQTLNHKQVWKKINMNKNRQKNATDYYKLEYQYESWIKFSIIVDNTFQCPRNSTLLGISDTLVIIR